MGLREFFGAVGENLARQLQNPQTQKDCALKAFQMKAGAKPLGQRKRRNVELVAWAQHRTSAADQKPKRVAIMGYPAQPIRLNRSKHATPSHAATYAEARESCVKFYPCQHATVR